MKLRTLLTRPNALLITLLALIPAAVHAHHAEFMQDQPFLQGVSMPIHGLDHLLVAFAVAFIAVWKGGRNWWVACVSYIAFVVVGGFVNLAGVSIPLLEPLIMASIVVGGLYLAFTPKLPVLVGLGAIAFFAAVHGQALMNNLTTHDGGNMIGFTLGIILSAAIIQGIAVAIAFWLKNSGKESVLKYSGYAMVALTPVLLAFPALNSIFINMIE